MGDRFGIGIIGCGEISVAHNAAYRGLAEHCQVVAVSDVMEAVAQRRAEEFGVETVYPDWHALLEDKRIDAVAICTPHYLHAPMAIAAAKAGKHVLVEKPMCMNTGEVLEMTAAARANGVKLAMSSEVVNPRHRFIKEHVLPEIGPVAFSYLSDLYYRDLSYYEKARWRGTWRREGGGIFVNQAIYTWDTYQWLLGGVDAAYGYWTNLLHPNTEVEDTGYGLVRFKNGTVGKLLATSMCEAPDDHIWMRIVGAEGELYADEGWLYEIDFKLRDEQKEARLRAQMEDHLKSLQGPGLQDWTSRHDRRVMLQMYDIIQAVKEGRPVTVSPECSGEAMKILNGIHWSGWNHADAFRSWAYQNFDLPQASGPSPLPNADDSKRRGWHGGTLVDRLMKIVTDPTPTLEAPFLGY